jgi:CheY-like chemotaxis protein
MLPLLKVLVSKHASLEIDLGKDLPVIRANDAQIRQIVLNLVTNASDAIGDRDGMIRVTTSRVTMDKTVVTKGAAEGDYLHLTVSDTGRGMSRETRAKIFEPFFTTKPTGRGIGLSIVHGLVRGLGGAIYITSEPNKGATFQIVLPRSADVSGATNDPPSHDGEMACARYERTVLVVDVEDSLRQAVAKMLTRMGFHVLQAADGATAVNLLTNRVEIGAMLLDMTLPGPPIHEIIAVAAELRPDIKVIMTSAFSEEMVRATATAPQIRGFVRKPFRFEDLLKTLRSSLSL